ncbi:MAG: Cardiolipin synthase C [Steroidobacteraceae bacterium]|nr:Cardiolipin synthase C [Steroidobacteraceae bacterium]
MALRDDAGTSVHAMFPQVAQAAAGESGFRLLPDGIGAFVARAVLARAAARSLDLQYYMINADDTGRLLAGEVLAAADRGVRVRILLDDLYAASNDRALAILDSHPHIEVRLFNPWTRRSGPVARVLDFVLNPVRLNRRMHNKLFAADSHAVIIGGRNIGDEYFDLQAQLNFRDLDVLAVGPAAVEASASFDEYWNSRWAVPAAALRGQRPNAADLVQLRTALAAHRGKLRDSPYVQALVGSPIAAEFASGALALAFGTARVIADPPAKIDASPSHREEFLIGRLRRRAQGATRQLFISSPYFVPGRRGVEVLTALAAEGVAVSVLTNSLAASDVGIVHSGYARYRAPLLRGGVALHELRATSDLATRRRNRRLFGSEFVSLHAKYLVIDRRSLFVGSINLDPRSIERNTEVGLLIDSEELARQVAALFELASAEAFSYTVSLRDGPRGRSDALVWTGENQGHALRYHREPDTTWWKRFTVWIAGLLPFVESQL